MPTAMRDAQSILARLGDDDVLEAMVPAFRRYPGLFKAPAKGNAPNSAAPVAGTSPAPVG